MPAPRRKRKLKIVKSFTKKQQSAVKAITKQVLRNTMETKTLVDIEENIQLFHNKVYYKGDLLSCKQGTSDPNDASNRSARIGDELLLRNINVRFWLSNKLDRPNCLYKLYLFWYDKNATLDDATCYFTQTNKMLDRVNNENIGIIDQKTIFSKEMYDNGTEKWEHSYLATLNGNWKGKKIKYDDASTSPSHRNIGFMVACYDAYGTVQLDNISSFAYNAVMRFQDP